MNSKELIKIAAEACDNKKADNIVVMDMENVSLIADYFLICHGNTERQVEAIAREVKEKAEENEIEVKRMEGLDQSRWILIDLDDVICHIFHKEERSYYNLERLWGDAPVLPLDQVLTFSKEG
ncbi:ribosome silencing factor [Salirhabdus salicampi]|uniref:ribosome silencing factor n=1 Tax=Salirhabdus salicampi TaxID=476102 RepID=UPI0020C3CFDE|nr:ribosome silencing factor [Salirhabdus salicampi]MCP8616930.1 ribosome silencing factor [Salirhabdus salicampi]